MHLNSLCRIQNKSVNFQILLYDSSEAGTKTSYSYGKRSEEVMGKEVNFPTLCGWNNRLKVFSAICYRKVRATVKISIARVPSHNANYTMTNR